MEDKSHTGLQKNDSISELKNRFKEVDKKINLELTKEKQLVAEIQMLEKKMGEEKDRYRLSAKKLKINKKNYTNLIHSTTWKYTSFIRKISRISKRLIRKSKPLNSVKENSSKLDKDVKKENQKKSKIRVKHLKTRLYNLGFFERGLSELQEMYTGASTKQLKRLAGWELALWYANKYNEESAQKCLNILADVVDGETNKKKLRQAVIIEAECYKILGDIKYAKKIIEDAIALEPHPDLFLSAANLEEQLEERVKLANKVLEVYNLNSISLGDSIEKSPYDRLSIEKEKNKTIVVDNKPKVSVIMPVYNAIDVLPMAIESVLAQTWENLEVIVVDDKSTDETVELVEKYTMIDKRVKLIRSQKNGGAYVSRNLGLSYATGDFVTCNDADDWSHPEKIEIQMQHILKNPHVIANTSQLVRATPELSFYRRGLPGSYIFSNMSSLLFRREIVVEKLGYWDSVRFGADAEFKRRLKKQFGEDSIIDLETGPLSFARQAEGSLTASSAFGYHGYMFGARKEYRESHDLFHALSLDLRYDFPQQSRPFAIPEPMLPNRVAKGVTRHFDVIIVSDFRLPGGTTTSNIEEIQAQRKNGLKTGLVQMSRYNLNPEREINPKVRELIDGESVQMLVYGESISSDVLIIRHPPVLQEIQEYIPNINAEKIYVIVNQPPKRDYSLDGELIYDITQCTRNIKHYFGKEAIWYPIGPLVRETLVKHHPIEIGSIILAEEDWSNIIDIREWKRINYKRSSSKIKIGRHSRDQYVKWPSDPAELLTIYPEDNNYEVYVLGGATAPLKVLNRIPNNWHVLEFGEVHPKEFLSKLDVFVYYTHPDWIEAFGRVIFEAMAVGVPVIIPPLYKELFGEAAIYAEPHEVKSQIDRLMSDQVYYDEQVNKASAYVEKHFGYTKHLNRIKK
ncbi:MAG: glycosyltransferase [Bacillaceae bacterium]|nr:glycosyltransferase [Bacillaceae bacterium]